MTKHKVTAYKIDDKRLVNYYKYRGTIFHRNPRSKGQYDAYSAFNGTELIRTFTRRDMLNRIDEIADKKELQGI